MLFFEYLFGSFGNAGGVGEILGDISLLPGFNQMVGLFHKVGKTQLALVEAMPPGVVRRHHHGPHTGPPAFMMPQFVIFDLQAFIEKLGFVQQALFV